MFNYLENFVFGIIAGGSAAALTHPFYNMKNHLQNGLILTEKQYGNLFWLYRGLNRAILGYGVEKMIVFGIYNSLRKNEINETVSGVVAGFFASLSITPAEQLTIDKQLGVKKYNIRHLYQGWGATVFRECLGFGVHFTAYEYLTRKLNPEKNFLKTIVCGAGATVVGWGFVTPIDRIKTKIQSGTFDHKTYDYRGSFNGFRFAIMRAVPFHVTCFLVMEFLKKNSKEAKERYENMVMDY